MTAIGVAKPSAQGQEMISTVTAAMMPFAKEEVSLEIRASSPQPATVATAIKRTTGTKTAQTRSASRWIPALLDWARCTSSAIRAIVV